MALSRIASKPASQTLTFQQGAKVALYEKSDRMTHQSHSSIDHLCHVISLIYMVTLCTDIHTFSLFVGDSAL